MLETFFWLMVSRRACYFDWGQENSGSDGIIVSGAERFMDRENDNLDVDALS